jgi:hypothetical protein
LLEGQGFFTPGTSMTGAPTLMPAALSMPLSGAALAPMSS